MRLFVAGAYDMGSGAPMGQLEVAMDCNGLREFQRGPALASHKCSEQKHNCREQCSKQQECFTTNQTTYYLIEPTRQIADFFDLCYKFSMEALLTRVLTGDEQWPQFYISARRKSTF